MRFAGLFRKRDRESEKHNSTTAAPLDIWKAAEMAASIVDEGVETDNLSDITEQLSAIQSNSETQELFVFPAPALRWLWPYLAVFVILSLVFVYFLFLSVSIILFSSTYRTLGIIGAAVSLLVIVAHIGIAKRLIDTVRFGDRFNTYRSIMKHKTVVIVEDIAAYTSVPLKTVRSDLQMAIDRQWIPQGHFGTDAQILILSEETFNHYLDNRAAYDQYYLKQIEEHRRIAERSQEVAELLSIGETHIVTIKKSEALIKDEIITGILNRMRQSVQSIFYEVDLNPGLAAQMGVLLSYYLPTAEKLLDRYINLKDKPIQGASIQNAKNEIIEALNMLNKIYEQILDRFFKEQEIETAGDVAALMVMMQQENGESGDVVNEPE